MGTGSMRFCNKYTLLKTIAIFIVLAGHTNFLWFSKNIHVGTVMFFILSGFFSVSLMDKLQQLDFKKSNSLMVIVSYYKKKFINIVIPFWLTVCIIYFFNTNIKLLEINQLFPFKTMDAFVVFTASNIVLYYNTMDILDYNTHYKE